MSTRNLKKGCHGSDVLQLQKDLQTVGYYTDGSLDGRFGRKTDKAVRSFQRANGLKVDGIVGPKTRAALAAKIKAKRKKDGGTVQGEKKKRKGAGAEVETGRWNGHKFLVSSSRIYSFKSLKVKGSSELKDSKDSKREYVKRKKGSPAEVSLTIDLHGSAGCNVRNEALLFIREAESGAKDYFYVGSKKLLPCKLMLVDASTEEIHISHSGAWISASVKLTMKQAGKFKSWKDTEVEDPAASPITRCGNKKTEAALIAEVNKGLSRGKTSKSTIEQAIELANRHTASVRSEAKRATPKKVTAIKIR